MAYDYIRMKPLDSNKPSHGAVNAVYIVGYKPYGEKDEMTEVILANGDGFITNETVPEFEKRLTALIKPFFQD